MAQEYVYCLGCWWASVPPPPKDGCPLCGGPVMVIPADSPPPTVVQLGRPIGVPLRLAAVILPGPDGWRMRIEHRHVGPVEMPRVAHATLLRAVAAAREYAELSSGGAGYTLSFELLPGTGPAEPLDLDAGGE